MSARSRALEYCPGTGRPFGFTKCECTAPSCSARLFIIWANASMLPPIRKTEDKLRKTDDGADGRIRVSRARDEREIAGARILSRDRQTIWIHKVRMHSSELQCASIHHLGKCLDAPAHSQNGRQAEEDRRWSGWSNSRK